MQPDFGYALRLAMRIPWQSVNPQTLALLLAEIVTRDGTDYGAVEKSTEQKIAIARKQLQSGHAVLFWDAKLETASLLTAVEAAQMEKVGAAKSNVAR